MQTTYVAEKDILDPNLTEIPTERSVGPSEVVDLNKLVRLGFNSDTVKHTKTYTTTENSSFSYIHAMHTPRTLLRMMCSL